jgi:hypothetical protein
MKKQFILTAVWKGTFFAAEARERKENKEKKKENQENNSEFGKFFSPFQKPLRLCVPAAWFCSNKTSFILLLLFFFAAGCPAPCDVNADEAAAVRREVAPIVAALENFHAAKNDYPTALEELKPDFLKELPQTIGGRKFAYLKNSANKYTLRVADRTGGFYSGSCGLGEIQSLSAR